jgi:hypothetical protein
MSFTLSTALCACSSQQMYTSAQSWQKNQCSTIGDKTAYDQCISRNDTSYDTYKKESQQK